MKAAQVSKPGGNFEVVERPIPEPGRAQVRIKVEACGVCHSDAIVKESGFPGLQYPRVPGHEIAGLIDAVGADVTQWKPGQRVGVGWHGGHCFTCDPCRRGQFILCKFEKITGISYDGGYAEYVVVPAEAVAAMPDDLAGGRSRAAALRGHHRVQLHAKCRSARPAIWWRCRASAAWVTWAFNTRARWVFARLRLAAVEDKEALAKKLGAHHYIDTATTGAAAALQTLGGARVILATAPDSKAISELVDGLGPDGKLVIVGAGLEPAHHHAAAAHLCPPNGPRMALRHRQGFRGHAAVQLVERRPPHDRTLPAGESRGGLRSNDQRTSPLPGRADHG